MSILWSTLHSLFIASLVILLGACLKYDAMMFQQNSYRPERFLRWWKTEIFFRRFQKKYRVPLVVTARVKRLFVAEAIVVAAIVFAFSLLGWKWAVPAGLLFSAAAGKPVMLLANILVSPVEKAINRHYYNDAAAILESRKDLIVVGVTGSFGKTGTKNYLYRMLSQKYNTLVTPGNFNTTLGVIRTVREHLRPTHKVFIVEMGAKQTGDIQEICELVHPSMGIVTAVGKMHLETFKTFENIQRTKFELVRSLGAGGFAAVNLDSAGIASWMGQENYEAEVSTYGVSAPEAAARAENISYSASGTSFDIVLPDGNRIPVRTRVVGACNILNILGAAMVASRLGVTPSQIRLACAALEPVEHRLSISSNGLYTVVDDAYNANPEGSRMALEVLSRLELPKGANRIVITPGYVEMGSAQVEECTALGTAAASVCDYLIVVNKLNRDAIVAGAKAAGMNEDRIITADNLAQATAALSGIVRRGDAVLYENDLPDTFK